MGQGGQAPPQLSTLWSSTQWPLPRRGPAPQPRATTGLRSAARAGAPPPGPAGPRRLVGRPPRAPPPGRAPPGVPAVDAALGGGLPRRRMTELSGPRSSGRTALLHAALAAATRRGEAVALVDV